MTLVPIVAAVKILVVIFIWRCSSLIAARALCRRLPPSALNMSLSLLGKLTTLWRAAVLVVRVFSRFLGNASG